MFGILIVTHGEMANGIMDAVRMILGEPEEKDAPIVEPIVLKEGESPETLIDKINKRIEKMAQNGINGVLILTDLFGSSTTNAGVKAMLSNRHQKVSKGFEIALVSGLNLPMVLELIPALASYSSIGELTKLAVDTGRKGIINISDELVKKKKKSDHDLDEEQTSA
jgi:mannose/fructose-specific phosphotransferase system component IIA